MRKQPFLHVLVSEKIKRITHHYFPFAETIARFFPSLQMELRQANYTVAAREWVSFAVFISANYFMISFASVFMVFLLVGMQFLKALTIAFPISAAVAGITFVYVIFTPRLFVSRRAREIEKHLPFGLRQLLIHVRGGMSLYNAIVSISSGSYGVLSEEFRVAVKEMNTGKSDIEALEEITRDNPSLHFRRIMWQIVNALKTGSDVGDTLKEIVDNIVVEQRVEIKKYGAQLNPLALLYMVAVIIFPTLGIVFLVVLSTFLGGTFDIKGVMMMILVFLVMIQFVFIGVIKSKRPVGV